MNLRRIISISLTLNLALGAGVLFLVKRPGPAQPEKISAPPSLAQPPPSLSEETAPPPSSQPTPGGSFHWTRVASDNLKVYRDNLLAIGCPKTTVRDILLGEVNEQFDLRRRNVLASIQNQFWDFAIRGEQALRNEWGQPIESLAAERQKLIDELFGKDYGIAEAEAEANRELLQRHVLWMPQDKRDQLLVLDQQYQDRRDALLKSLGRAEGELTPQDNLRLEELEKEHRDARKKLLTPEEQEEFRLRSSRESLWAASLTGFEPTESEWRTVTRLKVDFEEAQANLSSVNLSDDERRQRQEALQSELDQAIKNTFGPKRFQEFDTASNGAFHEVQKVTHRYGLPDSAAAQAYEVQRAALARSTQLREDPTLSPESRQLGLNTLQQETERMMAKTLGEKVLSTYQRYGGGWLNELNQLSSE